MPLTAIDSNVRRVLVTDDTPVLNREPSTATEIAAKRARRREGHIEAITTKRRPVQEDRVVTDYNRTRFLRETDRPSEPSPRDRRTCAKLPSSSAPNATVPVNAPATTSTSTRSPAPEPASTSATTTALPSCPTATASTTTTPPCRPCKAGCVHCFGERACSDHFRTDTNGQRLSDDGLCQHCRDHDRAGIPTLPPGFTLSDEVAAYCQHLTDHYPAAAPALLHDFAATLNTDRVRPGHGLPRPSRTTVGIEHIDHDLDSGAVAGRALLLLPQPRPRYRYR